MKCNAILQYKITILFWNAEKEWLSLQKYHFYFNQFTNMFSNKLGRYYHLTRPIMGEYICPWKNGKYGLMIDLYETDTLRFVEYHYEPATEDKAEVLKKLYYTQEEMKNCPIVAEGIIVYWMKWCCDNAFQYNTVQLYEDYYNKQYNDYEKWQQRYFDYWKRSNKLPLEFAQKHLSDEMRRIANSKILSQYLPEKDYKKINDLSNNYIGYVKYKISQLKMKPSDLDVKIFSPSHNVDKIVAELKRINRKGFGPKQFVVIVKKFFVSISWLTDTTDVNVLKWMKLNNIVELQATKLQNIPENKNEDKMMDKLRQTFQRMNSSGIWEDKQEFYLAGEEKINKG
jgi:hypothetical protein